MLLDSKQPDDSEQFRSEQKNSLPLGSTVLCITFISFDFLHHWKEIKKKWKRIKNLEEIQNVTAIE